MKLEWKAEDRRETIWHLKLPSLRVTVHRYIDFPDRWLFSTVPRLFDKHLLKAKIVDEAKREALFEIRLALTKLTRELVLARKVS